MAKKAQMQKEQQDSEDELLNFDLQDLSDDDILAEDDVIELVELVEPDKDEDKTKELPAKSLGGEKPAAKGAAALKATPAKEAVTPRMEKAVSESDEERELDLSDLTLDMDVETTKRAETGGDDVITEADLENLLQETSEEDISFDLSAEGEGGEGVREEEVTDADLEALLQEATAEDLKETEEGTAEEKEILGIVPETEVSEEAEPEEEEGSLEDADFVADSFEETQSLSEPEAEEPRAAEAVPLHEEVAVGEPRAEKLVGISEERLEEIITRVVQDVVERVARESMASVAERLIGQAIEALRESLESSSEES